MRVDQSHRNKLSSAISTRSDGTTHVDFDVRFMGDAMQRLTLWEQGLLTKVLLHAAKSKRKTHAQRVLLALFVHADGGAE